MLGAKYVVHALALVSFLSWALAGTGGSGVMMQGKKTPPHSMKKKHANPPTKARKMRFFNTIPKGSAHKGHTFMANDFTTSLDDVQSLSFVWNASAHSGDCEMMPGATLTFRSNGTGSFDAKVMTHHTSSGDTWHRDMVIKSAGGSTIIQMSWDGPNHMNDDGTIYSWHVDFTYDGSLYGQLPSCTAYPYDSC